MSSLTRNPTPNVSEVVPIVWPPTTPQQQVHLEFGDELIIKQNLLQERMKLWSSMHYQAEKDPLFDIP